MRRKRTLRTIMSSGERLHGIDFLRALMMLLGVVLHTSLSFIEGPPSGEWMYRDPSRSPIAGLLTLSIHVFRMPVFFVMAGIFAALIWRRSGAWGLAWNRMRRIALPLIVGWFVLFPLIKWTVVWGITVMQPEQDLPKMAGWTLLMVMNPWSDPNLVHLWFLYQLLLLCGAAIVLCGVHALLPKRVRSAMSAALTGLLIGRARGVRLPLLVAVSWWLLMKSSSPGIDTSVSLLPAPHVIALYGLCFFMGWVLFTTPGALGALRSWAWLRLSAGVIALLLAVAGSIGWYASRSELQADAAAPMRGNENALVVAQFGSALAIWLLAFGAIGAAERLFTRPHKWIRAACDSSYWVYLVHLPICLAITILLRNWDVAALVKMSAVIALTYFVCVASYAGARAVVAR